jgi:hypothetical protein
MRNSFRFIFPRLIGATVILGVAALLITILFKLLIGLVLIAGVVLLVKSVAGSRRHVYGGNYGTSITGCQSGASAYQQYNGPTSVRNRQQVTIVPIN